MEAYANDPDMPNRLRLQSQKFRWKNAATAYWQLYQNLVRDSKA
jgi:hypothetical protein